MLRNYLKIAYRTLRRQKGYAFINIAGLAVGLACCLLIGLFVWSTLSFDRFHEKAERIYRVIQVAGDGVEASACMAAPMGPALVADLPEVEAAVRLTSKRYPALVQHGEQGFYEWGVAYADANLFDVFSFQLAEGNPATALQRPYTMVLSRRMAEKYFGDEDPMGKTLTLEDEHAYEVTGVFENPQAGSSIRLDFVGSFATQYAEQRRMMVEMNEGWSMMSFDTFLLLREGVSAEEVEAKLPNLLATYTEADWILNPTYRLEPLTRLHLYAQAPNDLGPSGDVRYVQIFSAVALLILLLAGANYVNLATARATRRAREVGVRKAAGAGQSQLVRQFLGESLLLCALAGALGFGLAHAALPLFDALAATSLEARRLTHPLFLLAVAGLVVGLGLAAGAYPALLLARFRPTDVLKGVGGRISGARFRQGLVVFQFTVSAVLLIGALGVWQQLRYVQTARLGLETTQRVAIWARGAVGSPEQAQTFKQELLQHPAIPQATVTNAVPALWSARASVEAEGQPDRPDERAGMFHIYGVDADFLSTLGIQLKAGRGFSELRGTDAERAALLNETAVRKLGWRDPIGKEIVFGGGEERTVVGVVEDFHLASMREAIEPVLIVPPVWGVSHVVLAIRPGHAREALDAMRETWDAFEPTYPLDYVFLDDAFARLYEEERRTSIVFAVFFALAIGIACLGLFGLAAYAAEQRTKEIGIRKVLGASVGSIAALLSKDFLWLVLVAFAVAAPVAYLALQEWLADFAYRIDLGPGLFLLTGVLVLLIALLTVSYQAIRAATADPVKSLRSE